MIMWNYIGIPYPTDNIPGAIMPTLPTGADSPGWPYDPCGTETPTFVNGSTQYYVDSVSGIDISAGNGGRGSVAAPRKTLPGISGSVWTIGEGYQVFITDNSSFVHADLFINSLGLSGSPCWVIGLGNKPLFRAEKFWLEGSHLLLDNIKFTPRAAPDDDKFKLSFGENGSGFLYGTIRNCLFNGNGRGDNTAIGSSNDVSTPSQYICIYNNVIKDFGYWNRQSADGIDHHGIQPTGASYHWWIIENEIYHMEGDSIQINTSSQNHAIYGLRPHYMYIAGNHMYENYENAIDTKTCYHVIASQNRINNFHNNFKTANNTAFILANNSEGWVSGHQWALYNTIEDCNTGIKVDPDAAESVVDPNANPLVQVEGQKCYIIGNIFRDCGINWECGKTSPTGVGGDTYSDECWIVSNTLYNGMITQNDFNANQNPFLSTISGNNFYLLSTNPVNMSNENPQQIDNVDYNVFYSRGGSINHNVSVFNTAIGNVNNQDPVLLSPSGGKMQILPSSPSANIMPISAIPPCYDTFEDMYGIDIKVDFYGNPRPTEGYWSAGAFEPTSGIAKGICNVSSITIG